MSLDLVELTTRQGAWAVVVKKRRCAAMFLLFDARGINIYDKTDGNRWQKILYEVKKRRLLRLVA